MTRKNNLYGPNSIESHLSVFLKPLIKQNKKEFSLLTTLVKNWISIIGDKYYKLCYPNSVSSSKDGAFSLTISVYNPAIGFFLKNNSSLILERIASFYGYQVIAKINIKQDPREMEVAQKVQLNKSQAKYLDDRISNVEDKDLATSLARLGSIIIANPN